MVNSTVTALPWLRRRAWRGDIDEKVTDVRVIVLDPAVLASRHGVAGTRARWRDEGAAGLAYLFDGDDATWADLARSPTGDLDDELRALLLTAPAVTATIVRGPCTGIASLLRDGVDLGWRTADVARAQALNFDVTAGRDSAIEILDQHVRSHGARAHAAALTLRLQQVMIDGAGTTPPSSSISATAAILQEAITMSVHLARLRTQ